MVPLSFVSPTIVKSRPLYHLHHSLFCSRSPHSSLHHTHIQFLCSSATPPLTPTTTTTTTTPSQPSPQSHTSLIRTIYNFTRPHTIRGTIIGSISGLIRALCDIHRQHQTPLHTYLHSHLYIRAFLGILSLLFGNAFIVGINQIYDVPIDKINKPFLPLASQTLSKPIAWLICILSAILGLLIVYKTFSSTIFSMYTFGMIFGTCYSIPPFRFKQYPFLAAICISCVRGFLMNLGVYIATFAAFGLSFQWTFPVLFITIFMSIFACVIALSKDLPDIQGDTLFGLKTFASKLGTRKLTNIVIGMLLCNYLWAVCIAIAGSSTWKFNRMILGFGHTFLACCLVGTALKTKTDKKEELQKFYRFIWSLFYAEYVLFPFI